MQQQCGSITPGDVDACCIACLQHRRALCNLHRLIIDEHLDRVRSLLRGRCWLRGTSRCLYTTQAAPQLLQRGPLPNAATQHHCPDLAPSALICKHS